MYSVNRRVKNLAGTAAVLNSATEKKKVMDTQNAETDGRVLLLMLLFTLRTQAHSCMHFELCSLSFKGGGMVERLRYWIRHQEVTGWNPVWRNKRLPPPPSPVRHSI